MMELNMEESDPFIGNSVKPGTRKSSTSVKSNSRFNYGFELSVAVGILVPLAFTTGHMLIFYHLWGGTKHTFNPETCTCSCWDTVFKGPYESGIAHYKHIYFNSTFNTFKMWTLTILALISIYESFKRLVQLLIMHQLRKSMAILFLSSLHSNYYAWWVTWNYWNDEFYDQWSHQLFFTLTELLTTVSVFRFLDRRKPIQPLSMLIVGNIALFHILTSSWDQFISNVVLGGGSFHQVIRDLWIMSTDVLYLIVSLYAVKQFARTKGETFRAVIFHKKHIATLILLTFILFMCFLVVLR